MTITNERLAELERLLPNLKAWPNQYVQPQDVLELIRLARLAAVRKEECRAWRAAWDGRDDIYGDPDRPYRDPKHGHQVPAVWDDGGVPCESCKRFLVVEVARAATDAAERGEA